MWQVVAIDNQSGAGVAWSDGHDTSAIRGPQGFHVSLVVGTDRFINFDDIGSDQGHWAVRVNGTTWHYEGMGQMSVRVQSDGRFMIAGGVAPVEGVYGDLQTLFFQAFEQTLFPVPASALRRYVSRTAANASDLASQVLSEVNGFCASLPDAAASTRMLKVGTLVVEGALHDSSVAGVAASVAITLSGARWIAAAMAHSYATATSALAMGLLLVLSPMPAGSAATRAASLGGLPMTWLQVE